MRKRGEEGVRPVVWLLVISALVGFGLVLSLMVVSSDRADAPGPDGVGGLAAQESAWTDPGYEGSDPSAGSSAGTWPPEAAVGDGSRRAGKAPDDPQLRAMRRTLQNRGDAGVAPPFHPTHRRGSLTSVEGLPLAAGTRCDVRVLPVRTRRFNCLVRVMCEGVVLYPDVSQRAGYVPCSIEDGAPTTALDDGFTEADGDPHVRVDLPGGRVIVTDERADGRRYHAELRLDRS